MQDRIQRIRPRRKRGRKQMPCADGRQVAPIRLAWDMRCHLLVGHLRQGRDEACSGNVIDPRQSVLDNQVMTAKASYG